MKTRIVLASALIVVAVLGITFGVASIQANRIADASIHRAVLATRRAVEDDLAMFHALQRTMLFAVVLGVVLALIFALVETRRTTSSS